MDPLISMAALGRPFQLGDLYDYKSDTNFPTKNKYKPREIPNFLLEFKCPESNSKWEHVGNQHLKASSVAGFVKLQGAANYFLNEQQRPSQVTKTLVCRVQCKKEMLEEVATVLPEVESNPNATHIVLAVIYGLEAYCVFAQDADDEEEREEADEHLSKILKIFENALEDDQDPSEFKDQYQKDKQLASIKCRLYADFQTSTVRECNIFESFKHCHKLIGDVRKNGDKKVAPINIVLCPLPVDEQLPKYRDVDGDVLARCCQVTDELNQILFESEAVRNTLMKSLRPSLREFEKTLQTYQKMLRDGLKNAILKSRETLDSDDIAVEKVINIAQNHQLFQPAKLRKWLDNKKAESEMADTVAKVKGLAFLPSKCQIEKEMAKSYETTHCLVLNLPPFDSVTNKLLGEMKSYVEDYTKLVAVEKDDDDSDEEEQVPWHQDKMKRKQVLDKIRQFADYVEKNKQLEGKVNFFMIPEEPPCRYSIYEADILLKDNMTSLPSAPTGLRLMANSKTANKVSYRVEWEYEELPFPCHFVVQFRAKNSSDNWAQQKTSKPGDKFVNVSIARGTAFEFRVAADTCIGRSEFSEVIDTESLDDEEPEKEVNKLGEKVSKMQVTQHPNEETKTKKSANEKKSNLKAPAGLEVELVTQSTVELSWSKLPRKNRFSYRVHYWLSDQDSSAAHELDVGMETNCRIEHLEPESAYSVNIVATDGHETSDPSDTIQITTLDDQVRFAETIVKRCKKSGTRNGMDLYAVPLKKLGGSKSAERYVFGQPKGKLQHRTILVMGATGSGKTTLINGMMNYIFNVEWTDPFRFQLIQEQGRSQVESQTSKITAYEIHHSEGFRVPYSLTIVDTPGYGDTKGLDRDQEITEMVRQFFEDKGGIQELDVIGFVAQASLPRLTPTQIYIFDSVLSIFGNDVKENINFLLTFADSQDPPVLNAINEAGLPCPTDEDGKPIHHKFNNSGFFCSNRGGQDKTADRFNQFFWRMGMENFAKFFTVLATMKTKSLSLTKQVLDERKKLEATVDGLQPLIKFGLTKMEEMRKTKNMITSCQAQIEANENVEFEVEVNMPKKVENTSGYLTNCNKCYVTCHNPCAYQNDADKVNCAAMDYTMPAATRSCTVCPEKCIWNLHANQPYRWEYVQEKQATSSDAIKKKYEDELKKKLTAEELIKVLEKDVEDNEKIVLNRVDIVTRCIKRLDEIALRPNPFSTPQYIDLIIDAEQQEKRLGFKERIESLKKLRQMAVIMSKVRNKESLLANDRKDDMDDEAAEEEDGETDEDEDDDQQKFAASFYNN